MKPEVAEVLMKSLIDLGPPINAIALQLEEIEDENERRFFRRGLGAIMGSVWTEMQLPIVREYPDLDPDKDEPWFIEMKQNRKQDEPS
jgi:hypothetical protein